MIPKPFVTLVCGFGRCGSSLVMQMLDAGGIPGTGAYPAFEAHEALAVLAGDTLDAAWIAAQVGRAVKVLDPQRGRLPSGIPYRAIWMARDQRQQAASQAKMMRAVFGVPVSRAEVRAFVRSYKADRRLAHSALRDAGVRQLMTMTFEDVLRAPADAATAIDDYLEGGLDTRAMAAVVVPRGPECLPDMGLELRLIRSASTGGSDDLHVR